ncbi:hypothetical protein SCLARK_00598 [Spiroplasma clarkii]|uniref:Lipoprotein n=1 Tax=Spiroplasma clarkii TaxID=2139 RepID=A0A1Y0L0N6_9MOLU|nr:lipoprotein [Spiroplasma clarkii]ARU91269.1 hypothetical protein SCLARK_00598 [Spiroplasma clarkii]ATX70706.1 hypothetical protein SCLAR_v1c03760 [Spiroplasma clarkii]
MRKLLGLISAFSLTATASSIAVACGSDRIESPVLNKDLARQIIAKLSGEDLASIDFGDIFTNADISATVVKMINDLVSKQYGYDSTNSLLRNLGLTPYADRDSSGKLPEAFTESFANSAATVAEDKLFTEYTKSISSGTRMDLSQLVSLYSLNPIKDTVVEAIDGTPVEVKVGDKIYIDENVWGLFTEASNDYTVILPTIAQLTAKESVFTIKGREISAKTALRLRFQDYFNNSLMKSIAENLLTMAYIDSNSFVASEVAGGYEPFINTSSALFGKTQTWYTSNTTATDREWKTNVKMVWSLKFNNETGLNQANALKLIDNLASFINTATGELKPDGDGLIALMEKVIEKMNNASEFDGGIYTADDSNAYDSFFNQEGFKGLTVYESGSSIGTSPISGANYEDAVKNATKAGMLKNGPLPYFTDSSNGNIAEFVFVLPVYMIELLGGSDPSGASNFTIKDAADGSKPVNLGPSAVNPDRYVEIWNQTNNKAFHSKDVQELITNDSARRALINQVKYVVSQDSTTSSIAKTTLYSRYLDADDIFYAGLYSQIGTYIRNEAESDE